MCKLKFQSNKPYLTFSLKKILIIKLVCLQWEVRFWEEKNEMQTIFLFLNQESYIMFIKK